MARSSIQDPLDKFRFAVSWAEDVSSEETSNPRAGFHDVQMPKRTTNVINYREGVDPDINSKSAGLSSFEDVVLNRGLVVDTTNGSHFYSWMSSVHNPEEGSIDGYVASNSRNAKMSADDYRKNVWISMYDRNGTEVKKWELINAFPTGFIPGSDLNAAEDGEKSMEQLTLGYEDFREIASSNGAASSVSPEYT